MLFTTNPSVDNPSKHLRSCQSTNKLFVPAKVLEKITLPPFKNFLKRQLLKQNSIFDWEPCNQTYYKSAIKIIIASTKAASDKYIVKNQERQIQFYWLIYCYGE